MTFEEIYKAYHKIHVYLATVLCCMGLVANCLLLFVLTRRQMKSIVNSLLTTISLCDSAVMTSYLVYLVHFDWPNTNPCLTDTYSYAWAVFTTIHANLSVILRSCSLWLTAVMAGYRFYVIRNPYVVYRNSIYNIDEGVTTSATLVAVTAFGVLLASTPVFLIHGIEERIWNVSGPATNCSPIWYIVNLPEMALKNDGFIFRLALWTNGLLLKLIPCILLALFLVRLIYYLIVYQNTHNAAPVANAEQSAFITQHAVAQISATFKPGTLILTVILLVTFLLETPNAIFSVYCALMVSLSQGHLLYKNLGDLFDLFALLTSICTFVLYCIMSGMFRVVFRDIFCCRTCDCRQ